MKKKEIIKDAIQITLMIASMCIGFVAWVWMQMYTILSERDMFVAANIICWVIFVRMEFGFDKLWKQRVSE